MASKDKTATLGFSTQDDAAAAPRGRSSAADRWLTSKLLQASGSPPVAIVLWDGEEVAIGDAAPRTHLRVHSRGALLRLLLNPNVEFGDLYSVGAVDVDGDLRRFLETVYHGVNEAAEGSSLRARLARVLNRPRPNTLNGSRENIHHHYDIGNEFYSSWLDREMQYTCAYFPSPTMTLEEAQLAKMEHVCRKLMLRPGDTVVEAGCGWGGLARYMAREHGVTVRSYNISHEQVAYAREKASEQGLADRVEYVEDDYRNISGEYDVFVSVGMLEHVGLDNYPELGGVINRALKPSGRGLIHSIGRNKARLMNGWIEKRIFPGAYPPTLREAMHIFEPYELSVLDVENLRLHYAKTLEHWLERYEGNVDWVGRTFDERFVRAWRLYLAGSIAAFTTGSLQLFQIVFARSTDNELPWSRAHLYQP